MRRTETTRCARALVRGLACAWLCLLAAATTCAQAVPQSLRQLNHTAWSVKEGAPADVWALAQTRDGFLWLGTGSGLYRFDGVDFERFQSSDGRALRSINITALDALPSGELWVGYYLGGVTRVADGRLDDYTEAQGVPGGMVLNFAQDAGGALWVAANEGLGRFDGQRWQVVGKDWNYPHARADWVHVDRRGVLWVATGGTVAFLRPGARRFEETGEPTHDYAVLAEDPQGRMWLSEGRYGTRPLPDYPRLGALPGVAAGRERDATAFAHAKAMLFDREGRLWATDASPGGMFRVMQPARIRFPARVRPGDDVQAFGARDGLSSDFAVPILEDREGNIWVGTNLGLHRFRRNSVGLLEQLAPMPNAGSLLARNPDGSLWVADRDTLYRVDHDQVAPVLRGLPLVTSGIQGANGPLWLRGRSGLWRLRDGGLEAVALPPGATGGDIRSMAADTGDGLYAGFAQLGLYRHQDGHWRSLAALAPASDGTPTAMMAEADGGLWLGYTDDRVAHWHRGRLRRYDAGDGLHVGHVTGFSRSGAQLLVAGEQGIARLHGERFQSLTSRRHGVLAGVTGILHAGDGVWLNGSRGIVRTTPAALARAFERPGDPLPHRLFDYRDGLAGIALQSGQVPSAVAGQGGRLWFGTSRGIVWIDPGRVCVNPLPPQVMVRAVHARQQAYAPRGALRLPAGTRNLRIDYTATGLSIPERVRFRYRLLGADEEWQDGDDRRQAFYTNLGPGEYRFQVLAANEDGVWSKHAAEASFGIRPTFVQTPWFALLCVLAALLAVSALYLLRMRAVAARTHRLLEERHHERDRIARELHDTLLQSIQGLILRFQAVAERIPASEPVRLALDRALDRADDVLVEGRDRVRDLRHARVMGELSEALAKVGRELVADYPTDFRLTVEGEALPLDPLVRDEVYRIGREAVVNAFQHARAGRVEVELAYQCDGVRLRVRDDGHGMAREILDAGGRQGHWGLAGMRERADRLGARLGIWCREGAGTEIDLHVPAAVAYRGAANVSWWHRFRRLASGGR